MKLTKDQFTRIFPNARDVDILLPAMKKMFKKYDINTPQREASFLAQCGHESGGFSVRTENLNYSAESLDRVFGKYFVRGGRNAKEYARQPEKIANVVYANRMGNGDTASGDGWNYRGRGYIQLTGFNNYSAFAKYVGKSMKDTIKYLDTVEGALESALWFWNTNGLNTFADNEDIKGQTKRINGGFNGLQDREDHYRKLMQALSGKTPTEFGIGDCGVAVSRIQKALGLPANEVDGIFGPGTKRAVKAFQQKNGLPADGVAGPATLSKLRIAK